MAAGGLGGHSRRAAGGGEPGGLAAAGLGGPRGTVRQGGGGDSLAEPRNHPAHRRSEADEIR